MNRVLLDHLSYLFGSDEADSIYGKLVDILNRYSSKIPPPRKATPNQKSLKLNENDIILITYADMVQQEGTPPLVVLSKFLDSWLKDLANTVHLLPFYPHSSDDGFSVIDYKEVDPQLGSWDDIAVIGTKFHLMFDAVINHISAESSWFQGYLEEDPKFSDFFISVSEDSDLSQVFRPRALPLTTKFRTKSGSKNLWTTFSTDQIDLNYANPEVLLAVVDTLLFYVSRGARFIRLDAIAYLWKEDGTDCIHLPQTHRIIQLIRLVLEMVRPDVFLITETNVPHQENISYFGDGYNEAQLVYNFSLPPLVLYTFHSGDARKLSDWATNLETPSDQTHYFNFLASHDGIGLMPALGVLSSDEMGELARVVEELGGFVSRRSQPDGSESPYELNINFLDALSKGEDPGEDLELIARRFLTSQAIMLALKGVPGIYFHSLFGSRSWKEGAKASGRARTINRQKLGLDDLDRDLSEPGSLRSMVYTGYKRLLWVRKGTAAFHPSSEQSILSIHPRLFSCLRRSKATGESVLTIHNVSGDKVEAAVETALRNMQVPQNLVDLLTGKEIDSSPGSEIRVTLDPYQTIWLGWNSDPERRHPPT